MGARKKKAKSSLAKDPLDRAEPCWFCGCDDLGFVTHSAIETPWKVKCRRCKAEGPEAETIYQAIDVWNQAAHVWHAVNPVAEQPEVDESVQLAVRTPGTRILWNAIGEYKGIRNGMSFYEVRTLNGRFMRPENREVCWWAKMAPLPLDVYNPPPKTCDVCVAAASTEAWNFCPRCGLELKELEWITEGC